MRTLRTALLALAVVPLVALAEDKAPAKAASAEPDCHHPAQAAAAPAPAPAAAGWTLTRGEALKGAPVVKLADLLSKPQAHDGKTVRVEGLVRKACERKGCWMELASANDKNPGVRVTFKDYGFFVPLDSAGAQARVEGVVKVADLTDARAKHYEEEGAVVPRGADGKPREIQLVATGVELRR
ncbi:DUF4920 domain-containing protein [Corallococcus sp. H22C18031201]|uniref:DUF4920 domain-containing protein n=1 Tax=Citreicoccus inhibens TaxID=2849499 RepID=UPI000E760218|nr:DUF4920 domain-containing protein [Citreicoccus inhibens]MBU8894320.1 DUF4920 domain-containing protein [Citreicoccus inhibens]RJS22994.1 DUF4920 domain-containing protein [Corallococcus sp. H22C18031201]